MQDSQIIRTEYSDIMKKSYIDYAMSVIAVSYTHLYSIDSITAGITTDERFTRLTVVASGDELILSQIEKQLRKLEDVYKRQHPRHAVRVPAQP